MHDPLLMGESLTVRFFSLKKGQRFRLLGCETEYRKVDSLDMEMPGNEGMYFGILPWTKVRIEQPVDNAVTRAGEGLRPFVDAMKDVEKRGKELYEKCKVVNCPECGYHQHQPHRHAPTCSLIDLQTAKYHLSRTKEREERASLDDAEIHFGGATLGGEVSRRLPREQSASEKDPGCT